MEAISPASQEDKSEHFGEYFPLSFSLKTRQKQICDFKTGQLIAHFFVASVWINLCTIK